MQIQFNSQRFFFSRINSLGGCPSPRILLKFHGLGSSSKSRVLFVSECYHRMAGGFLYSGIKRQLTDTDVIERNGKSWGNSQPPKVPFLYVTFSFFFAPCYSFRILRIGVIHNALIGDIGGFAFLFLIKRSGRIYYIVVFI